MTKDDLVKLEDIAEEYFGLSVVIAKRKASFNTLPVPAFRLSDTGRGPLFVTRQSLEAYVDNRVKAAAKEHRQLNSV